MSPARPPGPSRGLYETHGAHTAVRSTEASQ
jgi:hypothetical protein